jgi:hypothetical protein
MVLRICSIDVLDDPLSVVDRHDKNHRMSNTKRLPKRMIDQPLADQNLLIAATIIKNVFSKNGFTFFI